MCFLPLPSYANWQHQQGAGLSAFAEDSWNFEDPMGLSMLPMENHKIQLQPQIGIVFLLPIPAPTALGTAATAEEVALALASIERATLAQDLFSSTTTQLTLGGAALTAATLVEGIDTQIVPSVSPRSSTDCRAPKGQSQRPDDIENYDYFNKIVTSQDGLESVAAQIMGVPLCGGGRRCEELAESISKMCLASYQSGVFPPNCENRYSFSTCGIPGITSFWKQNADAHWWAQQELLKEIRIAKDMLNSTLGPYVPPMIIVLETWQPKGTAQPHPQIPWVWRLTGSINVKATIYQFDPEALPPPALLLPE